MPRRAPLLLAALVLTAACGDDGNDSAATGSTPPAATAPATTAPPTDSDATEEPTTADAPAAPTGVVVEVVALDNSFRPEVVEIAAGDEVVFVNRGRNEHDALSVEGDGWGVEVEDFQPGDEYRHVFDTPGEYRYYCSIHGTTEVGMIGTVIVTG